MTAKSEPGMVDGDENDRPAWRHDDDGRLSLLGIDDWRPVADVEPETANDEEEDERDEFADDLPNGPNVLPDATDVTLADANVAPENDATEVMSGVRGRETEMRTKLTLAETAVGLLSPPNTRCRQEKISSNLPRILLSSPSFPLSSLLRKDVEPPSLPLLSLL